MIIIVGLGMFIAGFICGMLFDGSRKEQEVKDKVKAEVDKKIGRYTRTKK